MQKLPRKLKYSEKIYGCPYQKRQSIDVDVDVSFRNREYKGKRSLSTRKYRMVGVLVEGVYRIYITNVPTSVLSSAEVSHTCRARWEIELIFKEFKSHYRIHQLNTPRKVVVETLIYKAI
ncbi:transposase [Myxococcota bacterium]|nr:transposase [Myxococcota bacterium]